MTVVDQREASCRCEWGPRGCHALAPADVTIVVDVLSFSTCVDVAIAHGVAVLPYAWKDASAQAFAERNGAALAGARESNRHSLSPASFATASPGLRCVLPSPNGAALVLQAAARSGVVLTGCLRNARAVAQLARQIGHTFNVCPAGEQWPDGSLRPAIEDWLGAGAILRHLPGSRSPEAESAIATFEHQQRALTRLLVSSSSGRELVERGFSQDVEIAAALDVSSCAPRFDGLAFVREPDA